MRLPEEVPPCRPHLHIKSTENTAGATAEGKAEVLVKMPEGTEGLAQPYSRENWEVHFLTLKSTD